MSNTKPVRVCRGCSQEFTRESSAQRYCNACRDARAAAKPDKKHELSRDEYWARFLLEVLSSPPAKQREVAAFVAAWLEKQERDLNPEEIAHDDQAAIDSAFLALMDGVL